jgi:hypothetical protein
MTGVETALLVTALAGTAISAYGVYESGQKQQAVGKYNAKAQENEAIQARYAADIREQQQREQLARLRGKQAAIIGASGVDPGAGSPLLVMVDTARQGELDIGYQRYVTEAQARGYETAAGLTRFKGDQAARAGAISAGGTLLSGAASAGSSYYGRGRRPYQFTTEH